MILGTLGSDKSVTTINAVMTEVFAGVKPDEIRIYRKTQPSMSSKACKRPSISCPFLRRSRRSRLAKT